MNKDQDTSIQCTKTEQGTSLTGPYLAGDEDTSWFASPSHVALCRLRGTRRSRTTAAVLQAALSGWLTMAAVGSDEEVTDAHGGDLGLGSRLEVVGVKLSRAHELGSAPMANTETHL